MNNVRNGDAVYHDSIHPPNLILLNVNNHELSPDNISSIPSPDSPLSTPPDSPLRDDPDDDHNEEEKKKEDDRDQDDTKALLSREEVPEDEYIDNDTVTKNDVIPIHLEDEYPNDESRLASRVDTLKERTNGDEDDHKNFPSLSSTNSVSKPFDEDLKKAEEKFKVVDDLKSTPDEKKEVENSSIPLVPKVVRSSDNFFCDEVMKPRPAAQTTTSQTEKEADAGHREEKDPQSIIANTKPIVAHGHDGDDSYDEPPPLSLVEEAKKRLSAHGLSDSVETEVGDPPSLKPISHSKIESEENKKMTSEDEAYDVDSNNVDTDDTDADVNIDIDIGADADVDFDEPPSLSRVEEAMKRTSMMVLKHNQRDRDSRNKIVPLRPTNPAMTPSVAEATMSANDNSTTNNSESNRLTALQRDIMSLKSSFSDMNIQLHEDQIKVQKTAALDDNEDKFRVEKIHNIEENGIKKNSCNFDSYNDIPSTMMSVTTTSTELSHQKTAPNIEDCKTSFEQSTTVVSPDDEIDFGKSPNSVVVDEDDSDAVTNDNAPLHRNTCHVVPYADDENEIMDTKNHDHSITKDTKRAVTENEEGDIMDPNITIETTESSLSQDKLNDKRCEDIASYKKLTPKKDLQGSDKSAIWLQEELRRRAVVKREINSAIETKGQRSSNNGNGNAYTERVADDLPSISSPPEMQNSQSTMDEEVAAITANDERNRSTSNRSTNLPSSGDGQEPHSLSKTNIDGNISRKLEYGNFEDQPHDEFMKPNNTLEDGLGSQGFRPVFDYHDIQHEMKKFASETRAALRERSFTDIVKDPSSSAVPVAFSSPLSVNRTLDVENSDDHPDFQMNTIAKSRVHNNNINTSMESISINFSAMEAGEVPKMLISMDSFDGIASGDIFLSLLSENTGRAETSAAATWADRVHGAIWRARRMRKRMIQAPSDTHSSQPLVRGGFHTVASVQEAALIHLKRDEIDDSINLVEGIVFAYYSYFERSLNFREKNPALDTGGGTIDFKPYIGMALHNLGVLNLLKGDYDEALSYFTRAVENRKGNLGEDHPHYISSLVRLAVCRYALNEFAEAHAGLEEALACAKRSLSTTLEGRLQVAEILNNLGCLAYMSGQPTSASSYYRDSMDLQFGALSDSLYLGNSTSGQSISLNISIARANIGFIKLVTKDLSVAITALENALMEQQILLRGIDDTLIATMDHLALSNLLVGSQEKAALMYNRILTLQQHEYGLNDRRCCVTVEKMNMVQGKGVQYEGAIEELRKTFSVPPAAALNSSQEGQKAKGSLRKEKRFQTLKNGTKNKNKKKKVLKALTSMMKKNP